MYYKNVQNTSKFHKNHCENSLSERIIYVLPVILSTFQILIPNSFIVYHFSYVVQKSSVIVSYRTQRSKLSSQLFPLFLIKLLLSNLLK